MKEYYTSRHVLTPTVEPGTGRKVWAVTELIDGELWEVRSCPTLSEARAYAKQAEAK